MEVRCEPLEAAQGRGQGKKEADVSKKHHGPPRGRCRNGLPPAVPLAASTTHCAWAAHSSYAPTFRARPAATPTRKDSACMAVKLLATTGPGWLAAGAFRQCFGRGREGM